MLLFRFRFNAKLSEIRETCQSSLTLIIDLNPNSILIQIYSNNHANFYLKMLVGYKVAISIRAFISTERLNTTERSAQMAISSLKLEIEGWKMNLELR
jgi:hypothetical protein